MSEVREAADRARQRGLIMAAEDGPEEARSFVEQGRRAASCDHATKVFGHAGLLLDCVDKTLRAPRLRGDAAQGRQQGRNGGCYSGLCVVAVEPKRGGDAPDQVR